MKKKVRVKEFGVSTLILILIIVGLLCLAFSVYSKTYLTGNIVLDKLERQAFYLTDGLESYKFPYYSNLDMNEKHSGVETAIIVVHGTSRNAEGYWNYVKSASVKAGEYESSIIIAPSFKIKGDSIASKSLYWDSNNDWKQGDKSSSNLNVRKSSFEMVDSMILELNDKTKYPNLKQIIVTGHSAGGQFVNRYAAGNQVDKKGKVPIKYIIANPSSYLYFTKDRWFGSSLRIPDFVSKKICPSYNNYKYGLDNKNSYLGKLSDYQLKLQYAGRNVVYLLGKEDDNQDADLDKSCEAMLQGFDREERGNNYFRYLAEKLPTNHHKKIMVPGVGHSASGMYTSTQGVSVLFG